MKRKKYISVDGDYICQLYIYICIYIYIHTHTFLVFISTFSPCRLIISCISHMYICSGTPAVQESMLLTVRFNEMNTLPFEYESDVGDHF